MTILFKVSIGEILEAMAQMKDGTLFVWRESHEVVKVAGPASNILTRINALGKVGIKPSYIIPIITEEDLPEPAQPPIQY